MKYLRYIALGMGLWSLAAAAKDVNVIDFGAKGDGKGDDAVAIQKAIDACSESGGGQVLFPSGHTYLSGPLHLKSNIDLHLQANATLLANPDESIYIRSRLSELMRVKG